jgi:hypothetical protein
MAASNPSSNPGLVNNLSTSSSASWRVSGNVKYYNKSVRRRLRRMAKRKAYHNRHPSCIEHGKDDVGLPLDVSDGGRSNVDDEEVHDPVGACRNRRTSLAETERKDLRGVDPDGGLETDGECTLEDEQHCCRSNTGRVW